MQAVRLIAGLLIGMAAILLAQVQENELGWTMDLAIKQLDR